MNDIFSYDYKAIGKRIKDERKALKINQTDFAEKCGLKAGSRGIIGSWERGEALPTFETFLKMCSLFGCELGYLLCEPGYECKTREKTDIHKETGLSAPSIQCLLRINQKKQTVIGSAKLMLLNAILEDDQFLERAANALYALHTVPDSAIVEISFHDESGNHTGQSFYSDSSNDLKRLYLADLQNIIFDFLESQFQK